MQLLRTVIVIVTVMQISNSNMLHILQKGTSAAGWNNCVILHDGNMESLVIKLKFPKPVTIYSFDLKNANAICEMLALDSKTLQINWIVLCSVCEFLLSVINEFESSY